MCVRVCVCVCVKLTGKCVSVACTPVCKTHGM